jgi:hypothetical protein
MTAALSFSRSSAPSPTDIRRFGDILPRQRRDRDRHRWVERRRQHPDPGELPDRERERRRLEWRHRHPRQADDNRIMDNDIIANYGDGII